MTDKAIYRMSAAGYCPRKLSAIRLGLEAKEVPKWLATSADEGNWHEQRIKDKLRAEGYAVLHEQDGFDILRPTYILRGHVDGTITNGEGKDRLLEIKSMSQFEFDRWMRGGFVAFPEYAGQLACYFYAAQLDECLYIVKNRNNGYEDRRLVKAIENGLFAIEPILEKLIEVEALAQEGKLCEAEFDLNSIECKRCLYKHLCLPKVKELTETDKTTLTILAKQWRKGKALEKQGKELYEDAKIYLEAYAKEQPERKLVCDKLVVSIYDVAEAPVSYTCKAYTACTIKDLGGAENDD